MAKQRPSLDEILSKRAEVTGIKDSGNVILKAFKAPASWDEENRSARFIMSNQFPDRYGDVVVTEGIETAEFEKNPVALLFHNSRSWPIGNWKDLEKKTTGRPPRLEGTLNFLPEGDLDEADKAAALVSRGVLRACSIGFLPLDWESIVDDENRWVGIKWLRSELLECSVTPVPAAAGALVRDAGGDMTIARELIEDVLDNWARDPATGLLLERKDYEAAYRVVKAKAFDDLIVKAAEEERTVDKDASGIVWLDKPEPAIVVNDKGGLVNDDGTVTEMVSETEKSADGIIEPEAADKDAVETKEPVAPTAPVIVVDVDTKAIDDATEKVTAFSLLIDGVTAKISKIFGRQEPKERIEPKVDMPLPPSDEAKEAAMSKSKAARERISQKGLV